MFYCLNHRTAGVMQAGGLCMSHPLFSRFFWRQPVSLQSEQRSVNPRQPAAQRQQQVHDPLQITCKQQTGQRHFSYLLERTYFLVCSSYYLRCSTRLDFRSYYIFFIFVYLFSKVIKPLSTKDRNTYVWNLGSLKAYLLWKCNENDIFLLFVTASLWCHTDEHAVLVLLVGFEVVLHHCVDAIPQRLVMLLLLIQRLFLPLQSHHAAPKSFTQLHLVDSRRNVKTVGSFTFCCWDFRQIFKNKTHLQIYWFVHLHYILTLLIIHILTRNYYFYFLFYLPGVEILLFFIQIGLLLLICRRALSRIADASLGPTKMTILFKNRYFWCDSPVFYPF